MAKREFEWSEEAIKALRQAEQSTGDRHALKRLQGGDGTVANSR